MPLPALPALPFSPTALPPRAALLLLAALLQRLRDQRSGGDIVYAPEFRREIEEPVAGAIAVLPQTQLVITEGNYLLLWPAAAALLDLSLIHI